MNHLFSKLGLHVHVAEKEESDSSEERLFKLPIQYLDESHKHTFSAIVSSDLEMVQSESDMPSIYETVLKPKHEFAKKMIPKWNESFSTHIPFLEDSQQVLREMHQFMESVDPEKTVDCQRLQEIWDNVREDTFFAEKYSFIEFPMFKYLNESPTFLQMISVMQILSPVISLLLPLIFLFLPFFLLKLRNTPITFEMYLDILKSIAQNHFIGKAVSCMQGKMCLESAAYLILILAFYGIQIYQNVVACLRFYRNTKTMNQYLHDLREYLDFAIANMKRFGEMHSEKTTYAPFCKDVATHCNVLGSIREELESIEPFSHNLGKVGSLGYMLKCLYRIHDNQEYGSALQYSFAFEGYLDNLQGLYENLATNVVHFATFEKGAKTQIKEQYYPPHAHTEHVKNNCKLDKNMIVSAPNASGKTTYLKTTAINIVLSQQFGCGFYDSAVLEPYTHVHSYLNIPDTSGRDSLFQAESRRCKDIIDTVVKNGEHDCRHFCILDELYSGTNPTEATKAAYGFLTYLNNCSHVDYILTTHYVSVCKKFKKSKLVQNYKMNVEDCEGGAIRYTYKLKRGISTIQGATKILKDMEYPKEILDTMEKY
jgi:hypothetical protein